IYLKNEDSSFPCGLQGRMLLKCKNFRDGNNAIEMDGILGNKLINTRFLRSLYITRWNKRAIAKSIFRQGYFAITEKCYSIFNGNDEQELTTYLLQESQSDTKEMCRKQLSLSDPEFSVDQIELYKKLRTT